MKLFMLEPEVAGEIGENTIYDNFDDVRYRGAYPKISHLHFIFSGWLGDCIIESAPCFIVTDELKSKIEKSGLKGYKFEDLEVSLSDEFIEMYPNRDIPQFKRLIPMGSVVVYDETYTQWSGEDFNLSNKSYLVVSEKVLDILKECNIDNCDIYELIEKVDS
ncbi:hypothetical protein [Clostridium saccharobutylicum]|uniref:Uncharacterized protein n=1 Tax=Clostridium saccharobutylicum TaxID=169679 RepID=A0A1S8MQ50_CLOSA|nr:hypothetical protein [Clostridium saccharobutylicum]OOM06323.1 hypothetical protein CLOSAC_42420 [Clostridium saccharobutylicum]